MVRPPDWTPKRIEAERVAMEKWFKDERQYSLTKFAASRGYGFDWLKELSEKTEKFTRSYKRCKGLCADRIAEKAFENKGNATMAIFMLKCNHGWKEPEKETDKGSIIHVHLPEVESSRTFEVPAKEQE